MYAAGEFRSQQAVNFLMPGDAAHSGKSGRHDGQPEVRIRRRAAMHMTFVQHFKKCRLEFQPQFAFEKLSAWNSTPRLPRGTI